MRRVLVLALLAVGAGAYAGRWRVPAADWDLVLDRSRVQRLGGIVATGASPLAVIYEQAFTLSRSALPDCTGDATCVALCYSTGSAWTCIDHSGATLNTVTQGSGTTYAALPWSSTMSTMTAITDAKAPTVLATVLNTVYGSDHTVVIGGYGKDLNATNIQYLLEQLSAIGGLYVRQQSGVMNCAWFGDSLASSTNRTASLGGTAVPVDGWFTSSCRRSGNTYTARVGGTDGTPATIVITSFGADAKTGYFGSRASGSYPLQGPLAFVAWYSESKTAAQLNTIDGRFWGSGPMAGGWPAIRFQDYDGGTVEALNSFAQTIHAAGLSIPRGVTNVWGGSALHADGTTAIAAPVITVDAGPGPFDGWYGRGQTCALVVDANAAAFSGSESATAGAANGLYTMSAYLASGTTGVTTTKARLSVVTTGGTGGTDCDITLTSTPTRYRCTASVAGATAVKGRVLVGNAAADTGSIQVCHSQFELSGFPTEPTLNSTAVSESTAYLPAAELSTWPYGSSSRGAVEVVFTPGYNFGAQNSGWPTTTSIFASGSEVFDNNDTFYLLDAVDSAPNHEVIMWWPGNQTKAFARLQASDGGINEVSTSGTTTLSKTTQYVERISWTASGGLCTLSLFLDTCADHATCRATTLIAGPGAAGTCPDVAYNQAHFMRRYSSSFPTNAFLKAVRVYQ